MPVKTQRELIQELHQGIYGIPDTEEKGLIGDVKDLVTAVGNQNKRVRITEIHISRIKGILIGVGILGGSGAGLGLWMLLGG